MPKGTYPEFIDKARTKPHPAAGLPKWKYNAKGELLQRKSRAKKQPQLDLTAKIKEVAPDLDEGKIQEISDRINQEGRATSKTAKAEVKKDFIKPHRHTLGNKGGYLHPVIRPDDERGSHYLSMDESKNIYAKDAMREELYPDEPQMDYRIDESKAYNSKGRLVDTDQIRGFGKVSEEHLEQGYQYLKDNHPHHHLIDEYERYKKAQQTEDDWLYSDRFFNPNYPRGQMNRNEMFKFAQLGGGGLDATTRNVSKMLRAQNPSLFTQKGYIRQNTLALRDKQSAEAFDPDGIFITTLPEGAKALPVIKDIYTEEGKSVVTANQGKYNPFSQTERITTTIGTDEPSANYSKYQDYLLRKGRIDELPDDYDTHQLTYVSKPEYGRTRQNAQNFIDFIGTKSIDVAGMNESVAKEVPKPIRKPPAIKRLPMPEIDPDEPLSVMANFDMAGFMTDINNTIASAKTPVKPAKKIEEGEYNFNYDKEIEEHPPYEPPEPIVEEAEEELTAPTPSVLPTMANPVAQTQAPVGANDPYGYWGDATPQEGYYLKGNVKGSGHFFSLEEAKAKALDYRKQGVKVGGITYNPKNKRYTLRRDNVVRQAEGKMEQSWVYHKNGSPFQ